MQALSDAAGSHIRRDHCLAMRLLATHTLQAADIVPAVLWSGLVDDNPWQGQAFEQAVIVHVVQ
jgi:hypothetical protein